MPTRADHARHASRAVLGPCGHGTMVGRGVAGPAWIVAAQYDPDVRRLLRIAFAALAAVSGLLCVAAAGVWVRSHFVADSFERVAADGVWETMWDLGRVGVYRYRAIGCPECGGGSAPSAASDTETAGRTGAG